MKNIKRRYVIISPIRDEAEFLPKVIKSMENQTIRPVEWVVVDDGSTDGTGKILRDAAKKHEWITYVYKPDRGVRSVGPGVVETFYFGYHQMKTTEYDFIAKMDGDIEFKPHYVETLLRYFAEDKYLGSASGKVFFPIDDHNFVEERMTDEMTSGAFNFYRRKTFEDIGGFIQEVMWDGIAYHKARICGWRTRSIHHPNLRITHKRLMGSSHKNIIHGRLRWGRGQYFMGTHPLYIFAVTIYRMFERPFIIGGLSILSGYVLSAIQKASRYGDKKFRESLHAWQLERIKVGKRLENLPLSQSNLYQAKQPAVH